MWLPARKKGISLDSWSSVTVSCNFLASDQLCSWQLRPCCGATSASALGEHLPAQSKLLLLSLCFLLLEQWPGFTTCPTVIINDMDEKLSMLHKKCKYRVSMAWLWDVSNVYNLKFGHSKPCFRVSTLWNITLQVYMVVEEVVAMLINWRFPGINSVVIFWMKMS